MDAEITSEDLDPVDESPIAATFLVRITIRGSQKPPTNKQVEDEIGFLPLFDGFTIRASSERIDK